jgi:hypothetical protein
LATSRERDGRPGRCPLDRVPVSDTGECNGRRIDLEGRQQYWPKEEDESCAHDDAGFLLNPLSD